MKARRTQARLAIATALLAGRSSVNWGYELSRRAGVGPGSMYPFLSELLDAGHLTDGWEEQPPAGRPPRRYYRLTDSGEAFLRDFLASAPTPQRARARVTTPRPGTVRP